jgi:monoamine oxidase
MGNNRIAVVGAGIGGLATAYLLENSADSPLDITVFEASHRVGGKIQTGHFKNVTHSYEIGAAELYDIVASPALKKLVRQLQLPCVSLQGSPIIVFDGMILTDTADVQDKLGSSTAHAIESFMSLGKSLRNPASFGHAGFPTDNEHPWFTRTFADVLSSIPDRRARRYIQVQAHSDLATEPSHTNGVYGFDNLLIDDPEYCHLYSIVGGNERLPEELHRRLASRVRLGSRVRRITQTKHKRFLLDVIGQSGHMEEEFDVVILALPHQHLSSIHWADRRVSRLMRLFVTHHAHPAHYLRVAAAFEHPFWRETFDESYFILDAFGGCCVYDESSRNPSTPYGCLSWLIAGRNALSMHLLPDVVLTRRVLASLPGPLAKTARATLMEARVHRWIGSVSGQPGGKPIKGLAERHQPEASQLPGLFIVGDYLFDATINGALESAGIVAQLALQFLEVRERRVTSEHLTASAHWHNA